MKVRNKVEEHLNASALPNGVYRGTLKFLALRFWIGSREFTTGIAFDHPLLSREEREVSVRVNDGAISIEVVG